MTDLREVVVEVGREIDGRRTLRARIVDNLLTMILYIELVYRKAGGR